MSNVVAVRGLDKELYKRVKVVAVQKGITVRQAFEEALRLWLSMEESDTRGDELKARAKSILQGRPTDL